MVTTSSTTSTSASATTSSTSLGQSVLSSLNAGSGIDTASLISNLTAAQKASLEDPITKAQTKNTAQLSSAATLASDMTSFSSALKTLISGGTLTTQPTSSDSSAVAAALTPGKSIGTLSATVQVDRLAQGQVIESQAYAAGATLAAGSVTLTVGGTATTISLTNASNSVADLATAINAQKAATGVTASVATDASGGQRLVLKGTTGAAAAFSVASSDYAALNFDPANPATTASAGAMQQDLAAQDASIRVDGVTYTSATNTVGNAIDGVTLTLVKANSTVVIGAQRPTTEIAQAMSDFVSAYNALLGDINAATAGATDSADAGALRGNATIRDMQQQLKKLTTTKLIASDKISTLAELGVQTQRDGTLTLDTTTLEKITAAYPDEVERMFNPVQSSSNSAIRIASAAGTVAAGTYTLTGVTSASGGASATATLNGTAMVGTDNVLDAAAGSSGAGLKLYVDSNLSGAAATLTVDLGLSGALSLLTTALTGSKGSITALQTRLKTQSSSLSDQLASAERRVTAYNARLVTQFSSMNTRVSNYKATQSYLTQQVDLWTKSDS